MSSAWSAIMSSSWLKTFSWIKSHPVSAFPPGPYRKRSLSAGCERPQRARTCSTFPLLRFREFDMIGISPRCVCCPRSYGVWAVEPVGSDE